MILYFTSSTPESMFEEIEAEYTPPTLQQIYNYTVLNYESIIRRGQPHDGPKMSVNDKIALIKHVIDNGTFKDAPVPVGIERCRQVLIKFCRHASRQFGGGYTAELYDTFLRRP